MVANESQSCVYNALTRQPTQLLVGQTFVCGGAWWLQLASLCSSQKLSATMLVFAAGPSTAPGLDQNLSMMKALDKIIGGQ